MKIFAEKYAYLVVKSSTDILGCVGDGVVFIYLVWLIVFLFTGWNPALLSGWLR